jgi:hypothetical protein
MNGRLIAGALVPVMVAVGVLTAVPVLFNFLGLSLYAAALHECGRYLFPWWPRSKINIPTPPPGGVPPNGEKAQVTVLGNGAGMLIYPPDHVRRYDA